MSAKKALIAMSGGVDSSVAAHIALQSGYNCIGATMRLLEGADSADARQVAQRLDMPFYELDMQAEFTRLVQDAFVRSYEIGLTPNPCVVCNREVKFGLLLDRALEMGCDFLVTGHYAVIRYDEKTGRYCLCKAAHKEKDQSYFLYGLTQHQLAHTLFPLGDLTKDQVRQVAEAQGFVNAQKRDSQDICFIPDGDYRAFMERHTGKALCPGDFLDPEGKVVGRHVGAAGYTLGQRKGLGLAMGQPVYVCGKDMESNTVTVGPEALLFATELVADDWNWISIGVLDQPMRVKAKTRSRQSEQWATVQPMDSGRAKVIFDEPQRAITPGQAVVLYDGDMVVGGGTIRQVL